MSSSKETILVTGASGQLGRQAVEWLTQNYGGKLIATTRDTGKLTEWVERGVEVRQADFDQPDTLAEAFAGAQRLLLISTDALAIPGQRLKQHRSAIDAAIKAGVKHIVYTSLPNPEPGSACLIAEDHYETEQLIKNSGLTYTILRNNLYSENLIGSLRQAVATGQLGTAAGDGKTAYVTRRDCAIAAAAALASGATESRTLDVTGPEALTGEDLARIVSEVAGVNVRYAPLPAAQLTAIYESAGLPAGIAAVLVSFDTASSRGEYENVSPTVEQLTGRAPLTMKQFLAEHKELFAGA